MSWNDKVFNYCERGGDAGFWAEPVNALSNAAFVLAALVALVIWARQQNRKPRAAGVFELILIAVVAVIGVGSFLFHTLATRWAVIADTAPIGVFMLLYLAYAALRYLRVGIIGAAVLLAVFVASQPGLELIRIPGSARIGASAGYLPAWGALVIVGFWAMVRMHRAGPYLIGAAVVFAASLYLRTIDLQVCAETHWAGHTFGTHFLWHLLNALVLFVLLLAALWHGRDRSASAA